MGEASQNKSLRIAVLGSGFMGTALLKAWINAPESSNYTFAAHVRSSASLERLKQDVSNSGKVDLSFGDDKIVASVKGADIVVLGFLPTQLGSILQTPGLVSELSGKTVVSVLAGVSTQQLLDELKSASSGSDGEFKAACVIPTLGCGIGESVTLLATPSGSESQPHFQLVEEVFSHIGSVLRIPEAHMGSATAIGAAVHALAIVAMDTAVDASVAEGVPRSLAQDIVSSCLKSSGAMFAAKAFTPESMKAAMSTPGGITLNTFVHLDANTRPGIASAVRHAIGYTKGMND
ncbi:Pyrroline-5-carboxylate reductase [Pseudocercospora fuligena]|uniref:Pyrroline-5-carboxylate reductase n=1 Tax=Pseudocercospora fuligena TaxID=685502 RepID=A0A8H6RRV0_9PEZI|nr:Pyrroline-5-carboxylate reductase [Pseudocercospora fuligena]